MAVQADEIEALSAIYGDDLEFDDGSKKNFGIDLRVSSDESCTNQPGNWDRHIKLEFKLPAGYPATAPPCYTISAPWMSRNKKLQLTSALEEIYADNAGESILYMWIEKAREFLNEGIADIPDQESEDEDLENMNFDFGRKDKPDDAQKDKILIRHGEPVTDRRSTFQAHLARVSTVSQAKKMIEHVKENKKLATATHNISAYRISGGPHGTCFQDCDDDGENQAGGRLLHLMQIVDAKDVVIVVSRWFGGIQLGADRFKHINHVARDLVDKCGVLPSADATSQPKDASKKKKAK